MQVELLEMQNNQLQNGSTFQFLHCTILENTNDFYYVPIFQLPFVVVELYAARMFHATHDIHNVVFIHTHFDQFFWFNIT